jgi:hypothetical protein
MKLENMDKRCRELQRKSEVGEEQFRLLKGELDTERKKSLAQEKSFRIGNASSLTKRKTSWLRSTNNATPTAAKAKSSKTTTKSCKNPNP